MVVKKADRELVLTNLNKFVEEEGFGESTWTIDLCYILKRFNVSFKYTTITIGVDPGYSKEAFYDKVLAKDNHRVNSRFQVGVGGSYFTFKPDSYIYPHLDNTGRQ